MKNRLSGRENKEERRERERERDGEGEKGRDRVREDGQDGSVKGE